MTAFFYLIIGNSFLWLNNAPRAAHPRGNKVYDGETAAEALENVETIISEWIETAKAIGREILVPKVLPQSMWKGSDVLPDRGQRLQADSNSKQQYHEQ